MGRLVFLDIDGTLVNSEHQVPASASAAAARARAHGNRLFLCTGRNIKNVPQYLLDMMDGVVASTGSYIMIGNEVVLDQSLDLEKVMQMQKILEEHNAKYYFMGADGIFILPDQMMKYQAYRNRIRLAVSPGFLDLFQQVESYKGLHHLSGCDYSDADITVDEMQEITDRKLGRYFRITGASFGNDHTYCGEITRRGITKGTGMEAVANYFGMTLADTIGIGDGMNDFDMLNSAGVAVAMGNAVKALKKEADFVTASIDDDGIEKAFIKLGLI